MKNVLTTLAKRVTLEVIYEAIEERTKEMKQDIADLRQEINHVNTRIDQLHEQITMNFNHMNGRMDQLFTSILHLYERQAEKESHGK